MSEITQKLTLAQSGVAGPSGPTGPQGATIHWGSGVPTVGLGKNDDQYFDYDSADLYGKSDNRWTKLRNLRGPQGAMGNKGDQGIQGIQGIQGEQGLGILAGDGIPDASLGRNGEHYVELDSLSKNLHRKTNGTWAVIGTLSGPKGDSGRGISSIEVLVDGSLQVIYTDGIKENTGPFPVEGLGRHVCNLQNAGLDSKYYWAKIATFYMPDSIHANATLVLLLTNFSSAIRGHAMVTVHVCQQNVPNALVADSGISFTFNHGSAFKDDAFRLICEGHSQPVELWVQKSVHHFGVSVFEVGASKSKGVTIAYNNDATWQSTEPSAAYVKHSVGLTYGNHKKIYHEEQKPTAAEIGAVQSGGTVSIVGNGSGSASFDANGNLSLNLSNSYAASAGSANTASTAGNADTVDSLHGWQFIRSDVDDTIAAHSQWQDGKETRWGNDSDMSLMHNGSHGYLSLYTGDLYIRSGNTTKYLFDVSSGNFHADGHVYWQSSSVGSDPMLKTNVRKIDKPISRLEKLNGVLFDWKDSGRGSGGLMSPDIRKALPRTVYKSKLKKNGRRYDQADYNAVSGLLVEVCKDQEHRLQQQDKAFKKQSNIIDQLQNIIKDIQVQVRKIH
ncbi:tail fiber domain-containing protein [Microbulbifer sp. THAF38]|uniref:tail fiber domain-containing protein n=1 Tax=Microbulbifer sp. THAF38 TaxID=2587856 RepID=UPI0012690ACE|nr:tail fiber domain-containing protein [Microbulbifer sp. THAF38]QFT56601.1 hypothetical protein FIU95_18800 [Microbulbifer sp. THAF38]